MKIYDMGFMSAGANLKEAGNDWEITQDHNIYGVEDRNTLSFGFVRNTGTITLSYCKHFFKQLKKLAICHYLTYYDFFIPVILHQTLVTDMHCMY